MTYEFIVLDSVGNDISETVVGTWLTHDEEQELFLIETSSENDIGTYTVEVSTTSQSGILETLSFEIEILEPLALDQIRTTAIAVIDWTLKE